MKNAICVITYKPQENHLDFLNTLNSYDVYVIIDDNDNTYIEMKIKFPNLTIVQIDNNKCREKGYINTNTIVLKKDISGWDKALYYFTYIKNNYEYVWLLEDDVFFYNEDTLLAIDNKYTQQDILCNSSFEEAKLNEWLWRFINIRFPSPYYCGMMCSCRFSKRMFNCIKEYAEPNKTLFFLEALFPSIAVYNKLNYLSNPEEFITITHRDILDINTFNKYNLYHPVKNIDSHGKARFLLNAQK